VRPPSEELLNSRLCTTKTKLPDSLLLRKKPSNERKRLKKAGMVLTRTLTAARPTGILSRIKYQSQHRLLLICAGRPMELSPSIPPARPAVADEVVVMALVRRPDSPPAVMATSTEVAMVVQRAIVVAHRTVTNFAVILALSLQSVVTVDVDVLAEHHMKVPLVLAVPLKIVMGVI
jgi:hypothetical protein